MWPDRLNALLWTCAIEVPVYALFMRRYWPASRSLLSVVIAVQVVTQPALWQYTRVHAGGEQVAAAEVVVWIAEAALLFVAAGWLAAQRPPVGQVVGVAAIANALSWLGGTLVNALLYG